MALRKRRRIALELPVRPQRYAEPTVCGDKLHFTAAGDELGRPGTTAWTLKVPLADGRTLMLHLGEQLRQALRVEPAEPMGLREVAA